MCALVRSSVVNYCVPTTVSQKKIHIFLNFEGLFQLYPVFAPARLVLKNRKTKFLGGPKVGQSPEGLVLVMMKIYPLLLRFKSFKIEIIESHTPPTKTVGKCTRCHDNPPAPVPLAQTAHTTTNTPHQRTSTRKAPPALLCSACCTMYYARSAAGKKLRKQSVTATGKFGDRPPQGRALRISTRTLPCCRLLSLSAAPGRA